MGKNKGLSRSVRQEMKEKAKNLAEKERFVSSSVSVWSIGSSDLGKLGIGIELYFLLMKYLSVLFGIMFLIAIPSFLSHSYGHGITSDMSDPLGMVYYSLGNEGINDEFITTDNCQPEGTLDCTLKTVDTPFTKNSYELSYLISATDFIGSFIFLSFISYFSYRMSKAIKENDSQNITPSDYTVFVRGLPKDATEQEILKHFNELYDLSKPYQFFPMWFGCFGKRKKVKNKDKEQKPVSYTAVQNLDHLGGSQKEENKMYMNTYVAQISMAYSTHGALRTFLSMEKLTSRLTHLEKVNALYTSNQLENKKKQAKLETKIQKTQATLEKKTKKFQEIKTKPIENTENTSKSTSNTPSSFKFLECHGAYITFNHMESKRRCLDDYRSSHKFLSRWFQPKALRFRQKHALNVQQAPEPSNILWENLEISTKERFWRKMFTNFITFLLLVITIVIIYTAQKAQTAYKASLPNPGSCNLDVPSAFFQSVNITSKDLQMSWSLDPQCTNDSYKILYTKAPSYQKFQNLNLSCLEDPCTSLKDRRLCTSLNCQPDIACPTFQKSTMLFCMCKNELASAIKKYGILQGPQYVRNKVKPCQSYLRNYFYKNSLLIGVVLTVPVINAILKFILRSLANFERHHSVSSKTMAIAIKLFFAQFINTALIVLLVNANLNLFLKGLPFAKLFQGEYEDFERDWYAAVGMGISLTFVINVFAPHIAPILQTYVVYPLKRCINSRRLVLQDDMNDLYLGPPFDISVRYPLILNTLFVSMLYSGGMPILLGIASLSFGISYQLDKLTIIRLYTLNTVYDESLGEMAVSLFPWALIGHLGISMWMYGNNNLLQSQFVSPTWIMKKLGMATSNTNTNNLTSQQVNELYKEFLRKATNIDPMGKYGLIPKIVRVNVFPIFMFLVLYIVYKIVMSIAGRFLWPIIDRTLLKITKLFFSCFSFVCGSFIRKAKLKVKPSNVNEDLGQPISPAFTESYEQYCPKRTKIDEKAGFQYDEKRNVLTRKWVNETEVYGIRRKKDDPMLTWEAFPAAVKTYAIERNRKYVNAITQLRKVKTSGNSSIIPQ